MSSVSSLPTGSSDLIAALRQNLLERQTSAVTNGTNGANVGNPLLELLNSSDSASLLSPEPTPSASDQSGTGPSTPQISSQTLIILLQVQEQQNASQSQTASGTDGKDAFKQRIFDKIDANGDGQISQSELESAFAARNGDPSKADSLFAKLDTNGDGSVSLSEFSAFSPHRHHAHGQGGADAMAKAIETILNGGSSGSSASGDGSTAASTTTSVTNPDGSVTTTVTYPDGSTVTTVTPAPASQKTSTDGNAAAVATGQADNGANSLQVEFAKLLKQIAAAFGLTIPSNPQAAPVDQSV